MSDDINVAASSRDVFGKGASRRLRRENLVPAVVYGDAKDPQSVQLKHNEVMKHLENERFYSQLLQLSVDGGEPVRAILKDVQRHPYRQQILHMDFLRVTAGAELQVSVPLDFQGEDDNDAVKNHGAILARTENEVLVACRPRDIPENIAVDLSGLGIGDSVKLSDLSLPEGVRLVNLDPEDPMTDRQVAAVNAPRVEEPVEGEVGDDVVDTEATESPDPTDTGDDSPVEGGENA